jgi:hypothetical protein
VRYVRTSALPVQRTPRSGHVPALRTASLPARLALLPALQKGADEALVRLSAAVVSARAAGATWQQLGDALGVSPKVAWSRYCDRSQAAS